MTARQCASTEHHILNIIKSYIYDKNCIQWRERGVGEWKDLEINHWDFHRLEYRIKPKEPRVRYCVEAPSNRIMTHSFSTYEEAEDFRQAYGADRIIKFIEEME